MLEAVKYLSMTLMFVAINTLPAPGIYWVAPGITLIYVLLAFINAKYDLVEKPSWSSK